MAKSVNPTGKRSVVFDISLGFKDKPVELPCGTCVGCRLDKSRQWAARCVHESKAYDENAFVTLTYEDDRLPEDGSLRPRDFVLFMKRLRKKFGAGVRFFQCGEYGEKLQRPHHHALLFNCSFPDLVFYRNSETGSGTLYTSRVLEGLWGHGFCTVGAVTAQSAGYIARYALKKVFGPGAESHYRGRVPEYLTMSRRPGIGAAWFSRYWRDWYPSDEVIVEGSPIKPPRFYDDLVERVDPALLRSVKRKRVEAQLASPDNSGARLLVREAVKMAAVKSVSGCESLREVSPGPVPYYYSEEFGHV